MTDIDKIDDARSKHSIEALRIRPSLWRAVAFTRAVRRIVRRTDLDEENPTRVYLGGVAADILQRAQSLAVERREDQEGVDELLALSSYDQRALREAALGARQWGAHKDYGDANRAHRLLHAAITGEEIVPPTAEERERFALLDQFADRTTDEAWCQLIELEPRLVDLEAKVRSGQFSAGHAAGLHALKREDARRVAGELLRARRDLKTCIRTLVGPTSGQENQVASSFAASEVAYNHLTKLSDEY